MSRIDTKVYNATQNIFDSDNSDTISIKPAFGKKLDVQSDAYIANMVVTSDTTYTPLVNNTWYYTELTPNLLSGFESLTLGRIKYIGPEEKLFKVQYSVSYYSEETVTKIIQFEVAKDPITGPLESQIGSITSFSINTSFRIFTSCSGIFYSTLKNGECLRLMYKNVTNTEPITIKNCCFTIF